MTWQQELQQCGAAELSGDSPKLRRWAALSFRRDLRALIRDKPPHGILANIATVQPQANEFHNALLQTMVRLETRCATTSSGLAMNSIFGPWEGGLQAEEVGGQQVPTQIPLKFAAWNIRGALATTERQHLPTQVAKLVASLQHFDINIAVVSDPQLGPDEIWPAWTGYEYFGAKIMEPRTVALLVCREVAPRVQILDNVGSERALWFQTETMEPAAAHQVTTVLGLAIYANPPNHLDAERRDFWHARLTEWKALRSDPKYRQCPAIFLGDFNLHNPNLTPKDAELARPIDREMWQLLTSAHGFGLQVLNPPLQPTHISGSTLDIVLVSPEWHLDFTRLDRGDVLLSSDHYPVLASSPRISLLAQNSSKQAAARWDGSEQWNEALACVSESLLFVSRVAQFLATWQTFLEWVRAGSHRRLRQRLLDTIFWWRQVLVTMAGHLAGLARVSWSGQQTARTDDLQWLIKFFDSARTAVPDGPSDESLVNDQLFSRALFKLQNLTAVDPSAAQRFLTTLLKPKAALRLDLRDPVSNLPLTPAQELEAIADNITSRSYVVPPPADPQFQRQVEQQISAYRLQALAEAGVDHTEFATQEQVQACCQSMQTRKASMRLPRAAAKFGTEASTTAIWAIINLSAACGLVPSSWAREVAPVRKRGPMCVSDLANLRPISYVDEVESIMDALWLQKTRSRIEAYMGPQQHGGIVDAVITALGIIVAAQHRRGHGLPTLVFKADLMQGFDLTWRSGCLFHLWRAGVRGKDWLHMDATFSSDNFRVRLAHLVGPIRELTDFAVGQGKRAAVHLFGALTRALVDSAANHLGVGLGLTAFEVNATFTGQSLWTAPTLPVDASRVHLVTGSVATAIDACARAPWLQPATPVGTAAERLLALDVLAKSNTDLTQFVDDVFALCSTCAGLNSLTRAANDFASQWRHRFASGSKKPMVLPVNCNVEQRHLEQNFCNAEVGISEEIHILGIRTDAQLSFQNFFTEACSKYHAQAKQLSAQLSHLGLGFIEHFRIAQERVEPSAFFGIAAVASHFQGAAFVQTKLNSLQYEVAKDLLGISGISLGAGGQSRLFMELGIEQRLATRVATLIALTRARILCLDNSHGVWQAFSTAASTKADTWLNHARIVQDSLAVPVDFHEYSPAMHLLPQDPKAAVKLWKRQILIPAAKASDRRWFQQEASKWTAAHTQLLLPPPGRMWIRQAAYWPRNMQYHLRRWTATRLAGAFIQMRPRGCWEAKETLACCPFCNSPSATLPHVFSECAEIQSAAHLVPPWPWLVSLPDSLEELDTKIRLFGRIMGLIDRRPV